MHDGEDNMPIATLTKVTILKVVNHILEQEMQVPIPVMERLTSVLHSELVQMTSSRKQNPDPAQKQIQENILAVQSSANAQISSAGSHGKSCEPFSELIRELSQLIHQPNRSNDDIIVQLMVFSQYLQLRGKTASSDFGSLVVSSRVPSGDPSFSRCSCSQQMVHTLRRRAKRARTFQSRASIGAGTAHNCAVTYDMRGHDTPQRGRLLRTPKGGGSCGWGGAKQPRQGVPYQDNQPLEDPIHDPSLPSSSAETAETASNRIKQSKYKATLLPTIMFE